MRVLTYVDGILTVINADSFYSRESEKPSFIEGTSFYYEPTLQIMDGEGLTQTQMNEAEAYISAFDFSVENETAFSHRVDASGNYLGYGALGEDESEADSAPPRSGVAIVWDFDAQEWYEAMVVDVNGAIQGKVLNTTIDNGIYIREDLVDNDLCTLCQTYSFEDKTISIDIDVVKATKIRVLSSNSREAMDANVGTIFNGEPASWGTQEREALAWVEDNTSETPFIDLLLTARDLDETKADLVSAIIYNAEAYRVFFASHLGKLHKIQKAIKNATTIAELKAIDLSL